MTCELKKKHILPKIIPVEENLNKELLKYYKGEKDGYVQVGPKKWFYPIKYEKVGQKFIDFEIRPDDIWITGIPRSGTTLTHELAWIFANNLDFEAPKRTTPFFEQDMVFNDKTVNERLELYKTQELIEFVHRKENNLKIASEYKGRRIIKTHLPFELLPPDIFNKGCKVIYVCRYPKDVAVSYFTLQSKSWHINFVGDFKKYWNFFQNGNCYFGPYFEHVQQGFERKNSKNFLFFFFEDLRENLTKYINIFSEFFERPINDEEMIKIQNHLRPENMQKTIKILKDKNNETSQFIRTGKSGGWKEYFDDEMNEQADKWIEENSKKIGISYPGHN